MRMEHRWNETRKTEVFRKKRTVTMPLYPSQILYNLAWKEIQMLEVSDQ
jgi:hypothetical protein